MEALFVKGTDDGVFRLFTGEYTGFPVYSPVNIQEILLRHETGNFKILIILNCNEVNK